MDPETMALLKLYLAQQTNLDPTMQMMLGGLISPNVDKKGNLDQFGVDLEKTNLNQYQDIAGTFANPMNTLLSLDRGLSSVGAAPLGGGIAGGGGLNPITTETIMETPATLRFQQLAQRQGPTTPESYIAKMLVGDPANGVPGVDPSVILADLQAKMQDPNYDQTTKNLFQSWLPRIEKKDIQGNPSGEFVTDWNAAADKIGKIAEPYLTEQAAIGGPNIGRNNYGQYVQYSEQPSELMQYLQKLGLPDPRAQYGVDYSIQQDPELATLYSDIGAKGQAFDEAQKAYKSYLKNKPLAQSMARQAEELTDKRKQAYAQEMAKYAADMAEWSKQQIALNPETAGMSQHTQEFLASRPDPGGAPSWLGAIGGAIKGGASAVGSQLQDSFMRAAGARPPGPGGAPTLPSNVGPLAEAAAAPMARPTLPTLRGAGLMEQMYTRAGGNGAPDQSYALFKAMNQQRRATGQDMLAMVRAIAPGYGAMKAGRSPFKDALLQRLQPILAAGGANG